MLRSFEECHVECHVARRFRQGCPRSRAASIHAAIASWIFATAASFEARCRARLRITTQAIVPSPIEGQSLDISSQNEVQIHRISPPYQDAGRVTPVGGASAELR